MRLSDWCSDVCSSDLPPGRAKKRRYYEDRRFAARMLPAPTLASIGYRDLPAGRAGDWAGQVRAADDRLGTALSLDDGAEPGGLEQARHPAHEKDAAPPPEMEPADPERKSVRQGKSGSGREETGGGHLLK